MSGSRVTCQSFCSLPPHLFSFSVGLQEFLSGIYILLSGSFQNMNCLTCAQKVKAATLLTHLHSELLARSHFGLAEVQLHPSGALSNQETVSGKQTGPAGPSQRRRTVPRSWHRVSATLRRVTIFVGSCLCSKGRRAYERMNLKSLALIIAVVSRLGHCITSSFYWKHVQERACS